MTTPGTLKVDEPHPAAISALEYLNRLGYETLAKYLGAFANVAIEHNRLGEVCTETLNRFMKNQPISDRYLLGLAWTIKSMEEKE